MKSTGRLVPDGLWEEIEPLFPKRGKDAPHGLGKRDPLAQQYRAVGVRRDRNHAIYEAFAQLACGLIAYKLIIA